VFLISRRASYHFLPSFAASPQKRPGILSITPGEETSLRIARLNFISTPTLPELAGGTAVPFSGPTTNLSPTCRRDLTGRKNIILRRSTTSDIVATATKSGRKSATAC